MYTYGSDIAVMTMKTMITIVIVKVITIRTTITIIVVTAIITYTCAEGLRCAWLLWHPRRHEDLQSELPLSVKGGP